MAAKSWLLHEAGSFQNKMGVAETTHHGNSCARLLGAVFITASKYAGSHLLLM